jgi:hypothetical protein
LGKINNRQWLSYAFPKGDDRIGTRYHHLTFLTLGFEHVWFLWRALRYAANRETDRLIQSGTSPGTLLIPLQPVDSSEPTADDTEPANRQ